VTLSPATPPANPGITYATPTIISQPFGRNHTIDTNVPTNYSPSGPPTLDNDLRSINLYGVDIVTCWDLHGVPGGSATAAGLHFGVAGADTFGANPSPAAACPIVPTSNWGPTIRGIYGASTDTNLADGFTVPAANWHQDSSGSNAHKLTRPGAWFYKTGITCAPTGGIAVTNPGAPSQYTNYVWVCAGHPGVSGVALMLWFSEDYGATWNGGIVLADAATYPAFQYVYPFRNVPDDDWTYLLGNNGIRTGGMILARVLSNGVTDNTVTFSAYQFWSGTAWVSVAAGGYATAATIVPADTGEFSVQYNAHKAAWIVVCANIGGNVGEVAAYPISQLSPTPATAGGKVVIAAPTGWNAFGAYAPVLMPHNSGTDLYYLLAGWSGVNNISPYGNFLCHTTITN